MSAINFANISAGMSPQGYTVGITGQTPNNMFLISSGAGANLLSGLTARLAIDPNGNVGIGISTPPPTILYARQATVGGVYANAYIKIDNVSPAYESGITFTHGLIVPTSYTAGQDGSGRFSIAEGEDLGSSAGVPRLTISPSSGNVGIGTTDPLATLHINYLLRLEPQATAPTCSSANLGNLYVDTSGALCFCMSSGLWRDLVSAATPGACL